MAEKVYLTKAVKEVTAHEDGWHAYSIESEAFLPKFLRNFNDSFEARIDEKCKIRDLFFSVHILKDDYDSQAGSLTGLSDTPSIASAAP